MDNKKYLDKFRKTINRYYKRFRPGKQLAGQLYDAKEHMYKMPEEGYTEPDRVDCF